MQGLGRLTRTENDSHAAGAIRDLLMQAAEVDDANRGFQLENAGGLRCGALAYAVPSIRSGTSPCRFRAKFVALWMAKISGCAMPVFASRSVRSSANISV